MALKFTTDAGAGAQATFGLIVLQADETVENEFRALMPANVALYHSRVPSDPEVRSETLTRMEAALPGAVALLPPVDFDAIGYACTSGATIIGEAGVERAVHNVLPGVHVSNPITATKAALEALGAKRIAFITPYVAEVSAAMRANLEQAGFTIAAFGSFEQAEESVVAAIDGPSVLNAITGVGRAADCDAVFVSCTNLRVLGVVEEAEARIGKPVISSNTALAWHMLRLAGIEATHAAGGRLFRRP